VTRRITLWWSEAGKYQALPPESRTAVQILATERPRLSKPREPVTGDYPAFGRD
jgi:hypothetical protein